MTTNTGDMPKLKVGEVADFVCGDPRLLRRCKVIEKGISQMPKDMKNSVPGALYWRTLKWKGKFVFVNVRHIARAEDAKIL